MAATGDAPSIEIIVTKYRYLVRWVAKRFAWGKCELEDLEQEGIVRLIECLQTFDLTRGKFSTYLTVAVADYFHKYLDRDGIIRTPSPLAHLVPASQRARELARYVKRFGLGRLVIASKEAGPDGALIAEETRAEARRDIERRIEGLRAIPNKRYRYVALRRLFGHKFKVIAAEYGVSRACVHSMFKKAMWHVQNPDDYTIRLSEYSVDWLPDEQAARLQLDLC